MLTDSPKASGPCKRKFSTKVTTNGDPEVERKRKRLEAKEQSTKPAPTQKLPAKPAPRPRHPSIEIEEVEDESAGHTSVAPRNPQHVLEAADGTDDDVDTPAPPRKSTKKPVVTKRRPSVEFEEVFNESDQHTSVPPCNPVPDTNEECEAAEESDEAELGT
jgi:hypothetical protein